jgi:TolB protein
MGGTPVDVTNNPASDLFAAWSPDGSRLVFQSDRDADPELYLIELRTKRVTRLTMSPDLDGEPDWL